MCVMELAFAALMLVERCSLPFHTRVACIVLKVRELLFVMCGWDPLEQCACGESKQTSLSVLPMVVLRCACLCKVLPLLVCVLTAGHPVSYTPCSHIFSKTHTLEHTNVGSCCIVGLGCYHCLPF